MIHYIISTPINSCQKNSIHQVKTYFSSGSPIHSKGKFNWHSYMIWVSVMNLQAILLPKHAYMLEKEPVSQFTSDPESNPSVHEHISNIPPYLQAHIICNSWTVLILSLLIAKSVIRLLRSQLNRSDGAKCDRSNGPPNWTRTGTDIIDATASTFSRQRKNELENPTFSLENPDLFFFF